MRVNVALWHLSEAVWALALVLCPGMSMKVALSLVLAAVDYAEEASEKVKPPGRAEEPLPMD